jgi:hypothetical protein
VQLMGMYDMVEVQIRVEQDSGLVIQQGVLGTHARTFLMVTTCCIPYALNVGDFPNIPEHMGWAYIGRNYIVPSHLKLITSNNML